MALSKLILENAQTITGHQGASLWRGKGIAKTTPASSIEDQNTINTGETQVLQEDSTREKAEKQQKGAVGDLGGAIQGAEHIEACSLTRVRVG